MLGEFFVVLYYVTSSILRLLILNHYRISRKKFEPEPGIEHRTSNLQICFKRIIERQARDLEVRGSNSSSGSDFSLKSDNVNFQRYKL